VVEFQTAEIFKMPELIFAVVAKKNLEQACKEKSP
jgi:hypothetical protein